MANTERLAVLAQVREAKNAVGYAQLEPTLGAAERTRLNALFWTLNDVEGRLILIDISSQVDLLVQDSLRLESVAEGLRGAIESLNQIADRVEKAAPAIGVLVKLAELAASAGV
jgi:hypothetical protein